MKLRIIGVSIVFCVGLTGANALGNLSDGLVAYYPFDGDANDYSGNAHHGNEYGGLDYTTGIDGSAINLDGIDDYVTVPDAEALRMQDSFSVAAWVNPTELLEHMAIVDKMGGIGNSVSYAANYSMRVNGWRDALAHFENPTDADWSVSALDAVEVNIWQHIAFTKAGNSFVMYLNGNITESTSLSFTEAVGAYDLSIGASLYGNYGAGIVDFFRGQIDEIRIYDRAITADEVGQLAAIPEPSSAILIAVIGGFGLFVRRRFLIV